MSVRYERLPLFPGGGRHIHHDSRSLDHPVATLPKSALVSRQWERRIGVLDQKQTGSCTGNAGTGWLGTDNAVRQGLTQVKDPMPTSVAELIPLDEHFARDDLYSSATQVDPYDGSFPPDDTGSDGLSVAKVLKTWGLAESYSHAFSIQAHATALQSGPVLWGTPWYRSMFEPKNDGQLVVDLSSPLDGGHELCKDGLEVTGADIGQWRFWFTNSWSTSWGVQGRGYILGKDLALLSDGDFTVPVAPVTTPTPGPGPDPGAQGCFQVGPFTDHELGVIDHRSHLHRTPREAWATDRLRSLLR